MDNLRVDDTVYAIKSTRYKSGTFIVISKVERLTKTMAVLSNGDKLINKPERMPFSKGEGLGFLQHGDRWCGWRIITPDVLSAYEKQEAETKASNWFSSRNFTPEEKLSIYNQFHNIKENEQV